MNLLMGMEFCHSKHTYHPEPVSGSQCFNINYKMDAELNPPAGQVGSA
jgi:hypothetical protein